MKIIDELISTLSGSSSDTADALLKAQVLAHRINNQPLAAWVANELRGYPDGSDIPEYRKVRCTIRGTITNGRIIHKQHVVSLEGLEEDNVETLTLMNVRESISTLQHWIQKASIGVALSPELCAILSMPYSASGYHVTSAYVIPPVGAFEQMTTQIRSRLLEFCLRLSDEFPHEMTNSEVKTKASDINSQQLFANAVFGDGATVIVQGGEIGKVSNNIKKNDMAALIKSLKDNGVSDKDINHLQEAISEDSALTNLQEPGPKVRSWMADMLFKAGTAAGTISSGAAGSVLASAIQKYYGL